MAITAERSLRSRRRVLGLLGVGLCAPALAMPVRLRLGGTGAALGGLSLLSPFLAQTLGVSVEITRGLGTPGGIRAVAAGALDVGVGARHLTAAERSQRIEDHLWGTTPLVFATRADNPVTGLTTPQAVGMIGGEVTRWEDGRQVRITRRPDADGDTQLVASLSEPMARAVAALQRRPGVRTAITDNDKADALEQNAGSFGFNALGLIRSEARQIRVLTLDGRSPDEEQWPMQKPLVLVFGASRDTWMNAVIAALLDAEASRILGPVGYRIGTGA